MKTKILFPIILLFLSFNIFSQDIISQKELTESGIQAIEVKGRFCTVNVQAINSDDLSFKGKITGNLEPESYRIVTVKTGSTLRVSVETDRTWKNNWNNQLRGELNFQVPAGINCLVENSSGSVEVRGLNGGNINLSASSGSVRAESLKSNQEITISASSGSLRINGISANLKANTSSGSQQIDNVSGNVMAHASSGSIHLNNIVGSVSGGTSSGGVSLDNIKGGLNLSASSGSITGNNVNLTEDARFHTSSGGVSIRFVNPLNDLGFDLSASSGGLKVGENRGNKRLILSQGRIKVLGNSSSGSQRYDN